MTTGTLPVGTCREVEDALDAICAANGWEWGLRVTTGTDCAWAAEVRVTLTPNRDQAPDRSLVTYATGGPGPDHVAAAAFADMREWVGRLATVGIELSEVWARELS